MCVTGGGAVCSLMGISPALSPCCLFFCSCPCQTFIPAPSSTGRHQLPRPSCGLTFSARRWGGDLVRADSECCGMREQGRDRGRGGGREEGPHFSVSGSGAACGNCIALHTFWVLNSSKGRFLLHLQINCHCWYPNIKQNMEKFSMLGFGTLFFILSVEALGTVKLGCNVFSLSLMFNIVPF